MTKSASILNRVHLSFFFPFGFRLSVLLAHKPLHLEIPNPPQYNRPIPPSNSNEYRTIRAYYADIHIIQMF